MATSAFVFSCLNDIVLDVPLHCCSDVPGHRLRLDLIQGRVGIEESAEQVRRRGRVLDVARIVQPLRDLRFGVRPGVPLVERAVHHVGESDDHLRPLEPQAGMSFASQV